MKTPHTGRPHGEPSPHLPEPSARPAGEPGLNRRSFLAWTGALGASLGLPYAPAAAGAAGGATVLRDREAASRFLAQCTFGGDLDLIDEVARTGPEDWLDDQLASPYSSALAEVNLLLEELGPEDSFRYFDWVWWDRALTAPDAVRHRVAFALSEIFVISRNLDELFDISLAVASFHDIFLRHAFGRFRDLLLEVALHPAMGLYLSHLNNRRSDPSANRFPDENFAREVMQLFSIGLFELNPDGSEILDGQGEPVATYGNAEITEMAKIFTGLTAAPEDPDEPLIFGASENFVDPMVMYEPEHEPGAKTLLNGFVVPAGQTGLEDIEMAIDHLVAHPNTGPFIGRQLIQRLVTSNPSGAYVSRVAAAFADNGSGVRGDLGAVLRAVLLDPEARDPSRIDDPTFGKVREPIIRWIQLGRAFRATSASGQFRHYGGPVFLGEEDNGELTPMAQYPYFAPSVFNFFSPTPQPAGALSDAGLVAPELEIIHSFTAMSTINHFDRAIRGGFYLSDDGAEVSLDLSDEVDLAAVDPVALVDRIDLLLTYGTLSEATRQILFDAILPLSGAAEQVQMALYLVSLCPEYAVQR
ncbi:MAG: DUF1800 domain-containing protein [Acidobacteriota bacterium]